MLATFSLHNYKYNRIYIIKPPLPEQGINPAITVKKPTYTNKFHHSKKRKKRKQ